MIAPSRALEGVVHFDIARDLVDPDAFVATEVHEDKSVLEGQEALPEVEAALALIRGVTVDAVPRHRLRAVTPLRRG